VDNHLKFTQHQDQYLTQIVIVPHSSLLRSARRRFTELKLPVFQLRSWSKTSNVGDICAIFTWGLSTWMLLLSLQDQLGGYRIISAISCKDIGSGRT
jgi:hypothetical protein